MLPRPEGRTHYEKPAYHSGSFGQVTTKVRQLVYSPSYRPNIHHNAITSRVLQPPWFSIRAADKTRRPIEEWGNPRNVPRVLDNGAPFIHTNDKRCDRPIVTVNGIDRVRGRGTYSARIAFGDSHKLKY